MKHAPPHVRTLMAQAAELRAAGNSWLAISVKLGRAERSCRRWTEQYPADWQQLYLQAEERQLEEAGAESLYLLRKLQRSEDKRLQLDVSKFLFLRRREARLVQRLAVRADHAGDWAPFLAYLEKQTDADLLAFLQQYLAQRPAQAEPPPPADAGGGGEPVGG